MLRLEFLWDGHRDGLTRYSGEVEKARMKVEELDTPLKWIEGGFPKFMPETETAEREPHLSSSSRSSSIRATPGASRQLRSRKNASRAAAKRTRLRSVIGPVHSSKVSKTGNGKGAAPFDRRCARRREGLLLNPGGDDHVSGWVPGRPLRRSRRIAGQGMLDSMPSITSDNLITPRRSDRIAKRREQQQRALHLFQNLSQRSGRTQRPSRTRPPSPLESRKGSPK